ncbi:N-acetylmuramoyl-L-alanine amidase [Mycobacterium gordonae]|nr:N-acetylmuramoyl-L-alanine amidase [Mycobacterium gordonae]
MKIAIDAGHGPNTAGKRCPDDSMREFSFNSVVARYVRAGLAGFSEVETRFTHADDGARDVPLAERVNAANTWGADIFVSIHANAAGETWSSAHGIETFTATSPSAASVKLAAAVQKKLVASTGLADRGVKKADFYVIYKTACPAILVECGFMTNKAEAALLKSDAYRMKVAEAIVSAIAETYGLKLREADGGGIPMNEVKRTKATVIVNDVRIADGYVEAGVTYVPVRAVAEALGGRVAWDKVSATVTIKA